MLHQSIRLLMLFSSTLGAGVFWMPTAVGWMHFPTASYHFLTLLNGFWLSFAGTLLVAGAIFSMVLLLRSDKLGLYGLALGASVLGGFWQWGITTN